MQKAVAAILIEGVLLAMGIGIDRLFPEAPAEMWFAIASLMLLILLLMYWKEIKNWIFYRSKHAGSDQITAENLVKELDAFYTRKRAEGIVRIAREEEEAEKAQFSMPLDDTPKAPWHDDLDRCHRELVNYIREPYEYPIGQREIATTQAFLPHIVRLCRVLDKYSISYPPLDTRATTFTDTGKWGDFMARLMACQNDLAEARRVWPKMEEGHV